MTHLILAVLFLTLPPSNRQIGLKAPVHPCPERTMTGAVFTSSNLPIIVIETGGQQIQDEPKITAHMGIISNPQGTRNDITDPFNDYNGFIGIEFRGSSSQMFPKKSYAVETQTETGENRNVSLLGLPEENDWVLYAPYSDKSLLRNIIPYWMSNRIGRYASRTRFCELVLNGEYRGIYVLMEKIKQDKNRVKISELNPDENSGDDLTGGYIIKIDKETGSNVGGWTSPFEPWTGARQRVLYQFHEPDPGEITPTQEDYIRNIITGFESYMNGVVSSDSVNGYPRYIDVESFIDFFILNEMSRNVDAYRLSAFFYKDKDSRGGKLFIGPIWDFDLAFGNADYYDASAISGLQVNFLQPQDNFPIPFWWKKLYGDIDFQTQLRRRWDNLRQAELHTDSIMTFIDSMAAYLDEAQTRNFERWNILGTYVWPNAYVGGSYTAELSYLKNWIVNRVGWLDGNLPRGNSQTSVEERLTTGQFEVSRPFPNPASSNSSITFISKDTDHVIISLIDALGRVVAVNDFGNVQSLQSVQIPIDVSGLFPGFYLIRIQGDQYVLYRSLIVTR